MDGKDVKYVTTAPGIFPEDDRTFAPTLIPLLPEYPVVDWNQGHISKDTHTGELVFSSVTISDLPGVKTNWHPVKIDHLELVKLDGLRQNIHKVLHPYFTCPVVAEFAEFPWKIPLIESETTAYEMINGIGIGLDFLGHVTEAGRTIGFLVNFVDGVHTAGSEDLVVCKDVLSKLHALGLKHGDINKHNFLVGKGSAVMIDFESTKKCDTKELLKEEYSRLNESLGDPSSREKFGQSTIGRPP
jgi:serine/threonine protein kinase